VHPGHACRHQKSFCALCAFLWLKNERCPCPSSPPRCAKPTLKVFLIEEIVDISKEPQLFSVITQRQRIARAEISFRESFKSKPAARKRRRIDDRAEVITRRRKIEVDQHAPADVLCRDDRELMIGNHERAYRSRHLRRPLLCFGERVRSREIQRPERSRPELDFSAARDAAVGVEVSTKPSERIGREIDQSGEVEDDNAAQLRVEVSRT